MCISAPTELVKFGHIEFHTILCSYNTVDIPMFSAQKSV